jgi:hypothetical protein
MVAKVKVTYQKVAQLGCFLGLFMANPQPVVILNSKSFYYLQVIERG